MEYTQILCRIRKKDHSSLRLGDHVFLWVTPITRVGRVVRSKKLSSKFIRPYQILQKIGPMAYQVALPLN